MFIKHFCCSVKSSAIKGRIITFYDHMTFDPGEDPAVTLSITMQYKTI